MDEKNRKRFMSRAIRLSKRGFPAPNPRVGCVLVRDGVVVGEGYHEFAGGPHAEAVALAHAGVKAKGAEAFVTLEPCNHFGRTPPCSEALIHAGVSKVTYAVADPNPVAMGGADRLRDAGVLVDSGLLAEESESVNRAWLWSMRNRRPYVMIKVACSLDGRICDGAGKSQWITGERARAAGRLLRAECGAVLVGRATVEADDPRLTVRSKKVRNEPVRVILDPNVRLCGTERVFQGDSPTIWVVGKSGTDERQMSVSVSDGQFDLTELLEKLFEKGVRGLLVEGGAVTVSRFLKAGLVNEAAIFMGNVALGSGVNWFSDVEGSLELSPRPELIGVQKFGQDVLLRYQFQ